MMTCLFISLFIFVPTLAVGRDCALSDGYIRDHLENVTDNCDQECGWLQCGDVCINALAGSWCFCGEERLHLLTGDYYCCVDSFPYNRTKWQCSVDTNGNGHCPQEGVLNKGYPCNYHCFNDYKTSAAVGAQTFYNCGDWCVLYSWRKCQG